MLCNNSTCSIYRTLFELTSEGQAKQIDRLFSPISHEGSQPASYRKVHTYILILLVGWQTKWVWDRERERERLLQKRGRFGSPEEPFSSRSGTQIFPRGVHFRVRVCKLCELISIHTTQNDAAADIFSLEIHILLSAVIITITTTGEALRRWGGITTATTITRTGTRAKPAASLGSATEQKPPVEVEVEVEVVTVVVGPDTNRVRRLNRDPLTGDTEVAEKGLLLFILKWAY